MDTFSSESILWLYINKNVLGIDCIIGVVYIPYERSDYHADIYDCLVDDIITIKATFNTPVILMGDFNSRTGVAPDFEQMPENECFIFEESPSSFYFDNLNITNRVNKDKCLNHNGKKLIVCIIYYHILYIIMYILFHYKLSITQYGYQIH